MFERMLCLSFALQCLLIATLPCAEPVGWRTDGSGRYPQAVPPTKWSKDQNVVWCCKLPGKSNASPVLTKDKIFVCSEPAILLCVNRADGKLLWQKEVSYHDIMTPEEKEMLPGEQEQTEELEKQLKPLERQLFGQKRDFSSAKSTCDSSNWKIDWLKNEADYLKKKIQTEQKPHDAIQKRVSLNEQELKEQQKRLATATASMDEAKKKIEELKPQVEELKKKFTEFPLAARFSKPFALPWIGSSSSTPVTDGKHVYSLSGFGLVACYDLDSNRKWLTMPDRPPRGWGHTASPLLIGDKLILQIEDLVALNVKDGSEVWRAKVPWSSCWGTPVQTQIGGVEVVITPKGNIVRVSDGKVLADKLCNLECTSPIVHSGIIYFMQQDGKAVKLPVQFTDPLKTEELWSMKLKKTRYYASPLFHDGLIYTVSRESFFSVIDAKTGAIVYDRQLELDRGMAYPSITLAGNFIYVSTEEGATLVLEPGREYKEISKNALDGFRCSPVFEGKQMFVRTETGLYCIGE